MDDDSPTSAVGAKDGCLLGADPEVALAREMRRRREAAGLSQNQLADAVGYSRQYVSRAERHSGGLASADLVRAVDAALHAGGALIALHAQALGDRRVRRVAGRPGASPSAGPAGGTATGPALRLATDPVVEEALTRIRRALTAHHVLGMSDAPGASTNALPAAAISAHRRYQAAEYRQLLLDLPHLLRDADRARLAAAHDVATVEAYVATYVVAAKLLAKLGAGELAMLAADRAATAAGMTDSLITHGMATVQVVAALLVGGHLELAEGLGVTTADRLTTRVRGEVPALVSVAGSLWLISAVAAARRHDATAAREHLDRADILAELLGTDANHAWTAFGPTNTAIHRVSVHTELRQPTEALDAAAAVDPSRLPTGLRGRRAQIHLDLAWAQTQRARDAEATWHLVQAEHAAPETVTHNAVARRTLDTLLARATGSPPSLTRLAARTRATPT